MYRLRGPKRIAHAALGALACGLVLSACAGENLFTAQVGGADTAPEVLITSPSSLGATAALGDSIQVLALVVAEKGAASAKYSGGSGYVEETEALTGELAVSLSNFLVAAVGQTAGSVYIYVEVTDQDGATGIDSVKVTIS